MAMNFPSNPANGAVYQDYVFDINTGWRSQVMVGAAPCGSIMSFAGATVPAGWLLCDGSAVSRTTYSSLFAALGGISSPWGLGDGSTTFNLPDLRTRVPVGKSGSGTFGTLGSNGGVESVTLTEAQLPAHSHSGSTSTNGDHNHAPPVAVTYGGNAGNYRSLFATNSGFWSMGDWNNAVTTNGNHSHTFTTGTTGSGSAHTNLQPYAVVNYIIKFSAVVAATDTELAVRMGQAEATVTAQAAIVSGYNSRLTTVENNPAGLIPIIPTSVSASAGTATVSGKGKITLAGVTNLTVNGVFSSAYKNYKIVLNYNYGTGAAWTSYRWRSAGVDASGGVYDSQYAYQGTYSAPGISRFTNETSGRWFPEGGYKTTWEMIVYSPAEALYTVAMVTGGYVNTDNSVEFGNVHALHKANTAYDGFSFFGSAGKNGTIQIFGIRE